MFRRAVEMIKTLVKRTTGTATKIEYPSTKEWTSVTARQAQRAERSFLQLAKRGVPVFPYALCVDDDEQVRVQSASDVARRVMTLWGVNLRAEGFPQSKALEVIEGLDLWECLTDSEESFLMAIDTDPVECRERVWRLESIWALLWALGHVKKLEWPSDMCDVEHLVRVVIPGENDKMFITEAKLRPVAELLDMQDLTFRIHWAIRDALLNHSQMVPEKLDWTKKKRVPIRTNAPSVIVEHRHHAFNWLLNTFDPQDWDAVETHT